MLKTKKSRTLAIILAAALAVSALAAGLGSTLAAKQDVVEAFSQPNSYPTIEKGTNIVRPATGGRDASSSNTAIATATISGGNVTITGVKAGPVTVVVGSSAGWLLNWPYQIIDSGNLTGYTIKDGAQVHLNGPASPGKTFNLAANSYITTTPANLLGTITWRSLQENIATISSAGLITAKPNAKGVAIIVGTFTDKWGVDRDLHILVGVGVSLGGSNDPNHPDLGDLLEWIKRGEAILDLEPNPYTDDSLGDLEGAVNGGKGVLDMSNPTEQQIKDAIDGIKNAIEDLELKGGGGGLLGPDDEGNYYRPVGDPENVYEIVDKDGNPKHQPSQYVYNEDGDPVGKKNKNRPAVKGDDNSGYVFRVEDPAGSNIWKRVKSDGTLSEDDVIWGGSDGKPGGGDDKPVKKFGGDWWVDMGQNVWRKVNGPQSLGPLTGGGPNKNPVTSPGTPIYEEDGKYYIGPLGPNSNGHHYYYGDPKTGGNGLLDSTGSSLYGDDVLYYMGPDGKLTTTPPGENPDVATGGRELTPDQTGDTVNWIEIATWGSYSLIVRKSYLNVYEGSGHYGQHSWQVIHFGANTNYKGSTLQSRINSWFKTNTTVANGDNLAASARLRSYTMQNDAVDKLGAGSSLAGMTNAFSKPSSYQVGDGDNVAFALSYTEAASFCSITHDIRPVINNLEMQPSSNAAKANYGRLSIPQEYLYFAWLRTPGDISGTAGVLDYTGRAFQMYAASDSGLVYPALWVRSTIFTDSVTPSIPGLNDSSPSLNGTVSIDGRDWVLVRRKTDGNGKYAMLVSKTSFGYGQNFDNSSSLYEGSNLQGRMTSYYSNMNNMKQYAVVPVLGDSTSQTATSEPTSTPAGSQTKNIFFAISYQDYKNWSGVHTALSIGSNAHWWSRTQVNTSNVWDFITSPSSREASAHILGTNVYDVVGVWVRYA